MEKILDRSKLAKSSRRRGHTLERRIVNKLKELGYSKARTSRQASRLLDDSKVDIALVPFNIQCKKGYPNGINYVTILEEMETALKENYPEDDMQLTYPPIIIHDKGRKPIQKLVVMKEEDFFKLIKNDSNK
jgi:hypothetical protein